MYNKILIITTAVALIGSMAGIGAFLLASRLLGGTTLPAITGFLALAAADVITLSIMSRRLNKKG